MPVKKKATKKTATKKPVAKKKVAGKKAAPKKKAVAKRAPKGTVVAAKAVDRKPGYMYFVDGSGNVRSTKMNTKGGKRGRKICRKA